MRQIAGVLLNPNGQAVVAGRIVFEALDHYPGAQAVLRGTESSIRVNKDGEYAGAIHPGVYKVRYEYRDVSKRLISLILGNIVLQDLEDNTQVMDLNTLLNLNTPTLPAFYDAIKAAELVPQTIIVSDADGVSEMMEAGEYIPSFRVVTTDTSGLLMLASTDPANRGKRLGLSLSTSVAGEECKVLYQGAVEHGGWSWTADQGVFLADSGELTQSPPNTGGRLGWTLGYAMTPLKILFDPSPPILVAA